MCRKLFSLTFVLLLGLTGVTFAAPGSPYCAPPDKSEGVTHMKWDNTDNNDSTAIFDCNNWYIGSGPVDWPPNDSSNENGFLLYIGEFIEINDWGWPALEHNEELITIAYRIVEQSAGSYTC